MLFILTFGKATFYISVTLLWNTSHAEFVSWLLYKTVQSTWAIKSLNLFLFWGVYFLFMEYITFCFSFILWLIINIGKWSLISVLKSPCIEWLVSIKLFVNILSIKVPDLLFFLVGLIITGMKLLLYMMFKNHWYVDVNHVFYKSML